MESIEEHRVVYPLPRTPRVLDGYIDFARIAARNWSGHSFYIVVTGATQVAICHRKMLDYKDRIIQGFGPDRNAGGHPHISRKELHELIRIF